MISWLANTLLRRARVVTHSAATTSLKPVDTTSMTSEGTTTTRGDSWRYKGPKSLLGPASPAKRNPEKAMLF